MQTVTIPSVRQDERIGSSFNHIIQVVDMTEQAAYGFNYIDYLE